MPLGQSIFDALSTAAGHPINRGALNAQVAEAQSMNAYRDAETEEAFNKARMSRDQAETYEKEQNSIDHLSSSLTRVFGDPDIARAAAVALNKTGNLQDFYKGLSEHDVQQLQDRYENANANDRPIILQAILARQNPAALAQIEAGAPLKAAQTANENSETALHRGQLAQLNSQSAGLTPNLQGAAQWEAYRMYHGLPQDSLGNSMGHNNPFRMAVFDALGAYAGQERETGQKVQDPVFDHMIANNLSYAGTRAGVIAGAHGYATGLANQNQLRLETAVGHLQYVPALVQALHTGDFRPLDALGAAFGINMNQPAQVVAPLLAQGLGSEIAAVYAPAGATLEQMKAYQDKYATQLLSPASALSVKAWGEGMMGTRLDGLRQSFINNHPYTSPQDAAIEFNKGLTPITQQVYGLGTGQQLTGAGQNGPGGGATYGAPAAQPGPPGGGAPPSPAVSAGPAGAPPSQDVPRLTQTPPGTPGGTPASSVPGAQVAPPSAPTAASGGPPNGTQHPPGHQDFPTVGPHGFAPPTQLLHQAVDPGDPGLNHLPNGELWSWRAGDVPRYFGMAPVPTPGQGTTQTPNMPTGVIAPSDNGLNNPTQ